jgi:uncharacterized C2H2 Zn-finger protein
MRRMGGTNRGPKKRKLDVPLTEYPDANEWLKHLQQEGKNGGCRATLITITDEQGIRGDSVELTKEDNEEEENSTKTRRDELFTPYNIIKQFKEAKNGRSVPKGLARKETWEMIMEGSQDNAMRITEYWKDIHEQKHYPGTFTESEGCQIPKGNNKSRCKAVRVINKLCPAGKTFTKLLWGRSKTEKKDYAFGFTQGRRREQAILIANTVKWRLKQLGVNFVQSMHDVANAFPSMGHKTLDEMLEKITHAEDTPFLKARHKHSQICIPTPQGERLYVTAGQGGLQGDSAMAPEFGQCYEEALEQWSKNEKGQILATDPITGKILHVGTQMYADDVSDINIITEGSLEQMADERNKEMDEVLEKMDMAQNREKEEHIVSIFGKGCVQEIQELKKYCKERRENTKDFGQVGSEGKYLGNVTEASGKTKKNTDARISAIRESYYALQGFWSREDVILSIKINAFKGMVYNTALSGMEAELCSRQEIIKIDKEIIRLARKTLAGRACERTDDNTVHKAWTNTKVRKQMKIGTIESEMARRRVRWFKTMIANPEDNLMIRTVLSGKMEADEYDETRITPWMEQLLEDLTILKFRGKYDLDIIQELRETGNTAYLWNYKELVKWNEDLLRDTEMEDNENKGIRTQGEATDKCEHCGYEGSKQQVAMHAARKHKIERKMKTYVLGNQCPLCETLLGNRKTAIQHVEKTFERYKVTGEITCRTKKMNKKTEYQKTLIKTYDCEECKKCYKNDEAEKHLKEHIICIIKGEPMQKERNTGGTGRGVLGMLMRVGNNIKNAIGA